MRTNSSKLYEQKLFGKYPKSLISKMYCDDLLSPKEISEQLNITKYAVSRLLSEYKLQRDEKAFMSKRSLAGKKKSIETIQKEISKEAVIDYFIEQNHTEHDCAIHFNLSEYLFRRLMNVYEIKKGK